MSQSQNILYADKIKINEHISVRIPTVKEIIEREDEYYNHIYTLTASPMDMMVQLDDVGVDFTIVSDYELFIMMFSVLASTADLSLIFDGLEGSKFKPVEKNGMVCLVDEENGIVIDKLIFEKITDAIRKIHNLEKNNKKPANPEAKEYLIKRERKRQKRARREKKSSCSQLGSLIISLVNNEAFKYDFQSVLQLSFYQFNVSAKQIVNKTEFDNRMIGVYTGNVDTKDLKTSDLIWLFE